jgi:hypothetical protein
MGKRSRKKIDGHIFSLFIFLIIPILYYQSFTPFPLSEAFRKWEMK